MKKYIPWLFLCCLLLTGCVARTYWMGKMGFPAKPANYPIEVLLPGESINHSYQVLGIIQIDGWYGAGSETLTKGAQEQARRRGGDAIVLGEFGQKIVSYNSYIPGESGYAVAVAGSGSAAAAVKAPTPAQVVPAYVSWPTMSAIVLRYTDGKTSN